MKALIIMLQRLWMYEDGAIASEYVVLISLIGVVALTGVTILGEVVQKLFQDAADLFPR
jgi:Flp pilus assembly pilin Flp